MVEGQAAAAAASNLATVGSKIQAFMALLALACAKKTPSGAAKVSAVRLRAHESVSRTSRRPKSIWVSASNFLGVCEQARRGEAEDSPKSELEVNVGRGK